MVEEELKLKNGETILDVTDTKVDAKDAELLNSLFSEAEEKSNDQTNSTETIAQIVDEKIENSVFSQYIEEISLGVLIYLDKEYNSILQKGKESTKTLENFQTLFDKISKYYSDIKFKKVKINKTDNYTFQNIKIDLLTDYNQITTHIEQMKKEIEKQIKIQEEQERLKQEEQNEYNQDALNAFNNYKDLLENKEISHDDALKIFEKDQKIYDGLFQALNKDKEAIEGLVKNLVQAYFQGSNEKLNYENISIETTENNDDFYTAGRNIIRIPIMQKVNDTRQDTDKKREITFGPTIDHIYTRRAEKFSGSDKIKEYTLANIKEPIEIIKEIDERGSYETFKLIVNQEGNGKEYLSGLLNIGLLDAVEEYRHSTNATENTFEKNGYRTAIADLIQEYAQGLYQDQNLLSQYIILLNKDTKYLGEDLTTKITNYNKIASIIDQQERSRGFRQDFDAIVNILNNDKLTPDQKNLQLKVFKDKMDPKPTDQQREMMTMIYPLKTKLTANQEIKEGLGNSVKQGLDTFRNKRGGAITQLVDLFGGKGAFMKRLTKNFPAVSDAFLKKFKESYELKDKQLEDFTKLNDALSTNINDEKGEGTAEQIIDEYKKNSALSATLTKNISTINPILLYNLAIAYNKKEENTNKLPVDEIFEFNGNRQAVGLQKNKTDHHKDLINLIINSNDTWKTIKNAHSELAGLNDYTYHTDDAGNERKLNYANKSIASYADVSKYLSAYLVTGGQKKLTHIIGESDEIQTSRSYSKKGGELIKVSPETPEKPEDILKSINEELKKGEYKEITSTESANYEKFEENILNKLILMLESGTKKYEALANELHKSKTSKIKNFFTNPKQLILLLQASNTPAYERTDGIINTLKTQLENDQNTTLTIKVENTGQNRAKQIKIQKPNTTNQYRII